MVVSAQGAPARVWVSYGDSATNAIIQSNVMTIVCVVRESKGVIFLEKVDYLIDKSVIVGVTRESIIRRTPVDPV